MTTKGILVTTSGYGKVGFDLAQNKHIELIEGANLLYLLSEHTGTEAKIVPPDGWKDPAANTPTRPHPLLSAPARPGGLRPGPGPGVGGLAGVVDLYAVEGEVLAGQLGDGDGVQARGQGRAAVHRGV